MRFYLNLNENMFLILSTAKLAEIAIANPNSIAPIIAQLIPDNFAPNLSDQKRVLAYCAHEYYRLNCLLLRSQKSIRDLTKVNKYYDISYHLYKDAEATFDKIIKELEVCVNVNKHLYR